MTGQTALHVKKEQQALQWQKPNLQPGPKLQDLHFHVQLSGSAAPLHSQASIALHRSHTVGWSKALHVLRGLGFITNLDMLHDFVLHLSFGMS